ncbi:MAG: Holliday junction resolvase RuvX [Coriobacteriales bacterium]|jgi:putative Holliday junction resolvase|nr:Holliday junction resolvase RuvX [Coriobacteriales bacterium]
MRILALDIGEKNTGVAISDYSATIATPLCILSKHEIEQPKVAFKRIIEDYEPEKLLVGLPISLDGHEYGQAASVRETAEAIAYELDLPLIYWDERHSSTEAKRIMTEQGHSLHVIRSRIDMVAAAVILQSYLDSLS